MADLIELDIVVKDQTLKSSISTVGRLERQIIQANKAVIQGTQSQDRYNKILLSAKREYQALGMSSQKATSMVRQFAAANKAAQMSTSSSTVAINTNTVALQRNGVAGQQTKRQTNQLGVMMQQTGYQVGDFAVQVGSGQNVMVAFGQQATQLVGTMAMFAKTTKMIAIFSGLGIAIPVITGIAAAFMRMKDETKDSTEEVKTFEDRIRSSQSAITSVDSAISTLSNKTLETLRERYGAVTKEVVALEEALARVEKKAMVVEVQEAMNSLFSPKFFDEVETAFGSIGAAIAETTSEDILEMQRQVSLLQSQFDEGFIPETVLKQMKEELAAVTGDIANMGSLTEGLTVSQGVIDSYKTLESTIKSATEKGNFEEAANGISEMRALFDKLGLEIDNGALANMTRLEEILRQAVRQLGQASVESLTLTEAIASAADEAQRLAINLQSSVSAAEQVASTSIVVMTAQMKALNAGQDEYSAGASARLAIDKDIYKQSLIASGLGVTEADLATEANFIQQESSIALRVEYDKLRDSLNEKSKASNNSVSATKKQADALKKQADAMNLSANAVDKYNDGLAKLLVLKEKYGLKDDAFANEVAKLNEELANSLPLVNDVADAFGDFMSRGFSDFKSFASSIGNSFKQLLIKMATDALKSKILIPLSTGMSAGFAGSAASAAGSSAASAAGGAAGGAASGGMMAGIGATAGTAGAALVGGGMSAFGMSAAAGGSIATGMAAMPAMAAIGAVAAPLLAVAAVFTFFKKKTKELDSGLNVTVKGMDTLVESFSKVQTSRFFGLSKKTSTNTSSASSEVANPVMNAASEIQNQVVKAAAALGVGSQAFKGFTYNFKLSLKGLTEEQAMSKINEELAKMGNSFAALVPGVSSMAELTAIYQERLNLEIRLLQLQGNTQALRKIELNSVNDYNKSILKQIYATEDRIAADERAAQKADELAQKVASILAQRVGLEDKLLQLQGNTNELRARELALLDPSNRALQKLIFTTEDKIVADQKAATIADERSNLEKQLLGLQGNTNELRKIELAGLDESNRALQEQIYAHENAAEAIRKLEDALNSLQENDFASMLDFQRARANTRMGLPVANNPTMPTSLAVGAAAPITNANSSTVSELRSMREDIKEMHKESMFAYSKLIKNGKDSRDTLRTWDVTGLPAERTA